MLGRSDPDERAPSMTGYTRKWECPNCNETVEGIDWPREGDELCESCKERGARLARALDAFCEAYGGGCTWREVPQLVAGAGA